MGPAAPSSAAAPLRRDRRLSLLSKLRLVAFAALCLSVVAHVSGVAAAAPPAFPLPWLSNGYYQPPLSNAVASISRGIVVSPAALAGSFAFAPAPWTGRVFVNESCTGVHETAGSCRLHLRISLLHPDDDYNLNKVMNSNCSVAHRENAAGEKFDNLTMLLSERKLGAPGCSFGRKAVGINNIGVGALMHHACNPAAPTLCAPDLAITYALQDVNKIVTPYMSYSDAQRWREYLLGRYAWLRGESVNGTIDYSQQLIVSFPATGRLVPAEKAALRTIAENLADLQSPAYLEWQSNSDLQSWGSLIDNPDADPCLQRIMGLTCEDGHVTSVWIPGFGDPGFIGQLHPAWGSFPHLRMLDLAVQNFYGPMPDTICQLTSLQVFDINSQTDGVRTDVRQGITSLPDCLGRVPLVWFSASNNIITSDIPSTLNASLVAGAEVTLKALQLDGNFISRLPSDFSSRFQGLSQLWLRSNPLTGVFPSFKGFKNLQDVGTQRGLTIDHCELTGPMPADAFDGVALLATIDVSFNKITGPLPNMVVAVPANLNKIVMNNNAFTGGVPTSWTTLTSVTEVHLQRNALTGPTSSLSGMLSVAILDASYNAIINNPGKNFGETLAAMCSNAIVDLNLEHNQLSGMWAGGMTPSLNKLTKINIAYNRLDTLPDDMYTMTTVTQWDVSYNDLVGVVQGTQPTGVLVLNLVGNPRLRVWPLPSWLEATGSFVTAPGSNYSCPELTNALSSALSFSVGAESLGFNGCICRSGLFGKPPLCGAVPELARLNPVSGFSSSEVGGSFSEMLGGVQALANATAALPNGFTDDWYGSSQRLTNGVATTFIIDVQNLFHDTRYSGAGGPATRRLMAQQDSACTLVGGVWNCSPSASIQSPNNTLPVSSPVPGVVQLVDSTGKISSEYSSRISGSSRYQPVRMIRIQLHISRAEFNLPSDNIAVYEGDVSLSGTRIASVVGTDTFADPPPYPPPAGTSPAALHLTQTAAYWSRYGAHLNAIVDRTLVEVVVLSNAASVQFVSRAQSGTHFFATYSYEFGCTPSNQYFLDPTTNKCRDSLRVLIDGDTLIATPDSLYAIVASIIAVLGAWAANLILQVAVKSRNSAAAASERSQQPGASKAPRGIVARLQALPTTQALSSAVTIALCTVWSMQVLAFATLRLEADAEDHVTGSVEPEFQAAFILGALPVLLVCTTLAVVLLLYPFGSRRKLRRTLGHMSRVDAQTSTLNNSVLSIEGEESSALSGSTADDSANKDGSKSRAAQGGLVQSLKDIPFHVLTFQVFCAGMWSVAILVCHLMLAASLNTWGHVQYTLNPGSLVWCTLVAWLLLLLSLITLVYINHLFLSALMAGGATLVFFFATVATSSFSYADHQRDAVGQIILGSHSNLDGSEPLMLSKLTLVLMVLLPSCAISFILVALQTVKLRLTWDVMAKRLAAETKAAAIVARDLAASRRDAAAQHARSIVLALELSMSQHIRTVFAHIRNSNVDPSAEKRELTLWLQTQISEYVQLRAHKQAKADRLARLATIDHKTRHLVSDDAAGAEMSSMSLSTSAGGVVGSGNGAGGKADPASAYRASASPASPQTGGTGHTTLPQLPRIGESSCSGDDGSGGDEVQPLPGSVEEEDAADEHHPEPAPLSLIDRLNGAMVAARMPFFLTDSVAGAYVAQAAAHNFSSENSFFLSVEFFYARFCLTPRAKGSGSSSAFAAECARVARMLYASFIAEGSTYQINLAGSSRDALQKAVFSAGTRTPAEASELFAPVRQVVCDLIHTNLLTNLNQWDAGLMKALQPTAAAATTTGTAPPADVAFTIKPIKLPASPSAPRSTIGSGSVGSGAGGALSPVHALQPSFTQGRSPTIPAPTPSDAVEGARLQLRAFPESNAESHSSADNSVTVAGIPGPDAAAAPEPLVHESAPAVPLTVAVHYPEQDE